MQLKTAVLTAILLGAIPATASAQTIGSSYGAEAVPSMMQSEPQFNAMETGCELIPCTFVSLPSETPAQKESDYAAELLVQEGSDRITGPEWSAGYSVNVGESCPYGLCKRVQTNEGVELRWTTRGVIAYNATEAPRSVTVSGEMESTVYGRIRNVLPLSGKTGAVLVAVK